jgi:hypothetical protein
MNNNEKYQTLAVRTKEFLKFCSSHHDCGTCPLAKLNESTDVACAFAWLELPAAPDAPEHVIDDGIVEG